MSQLSSKNLLIVATLGASAAQAARSGSLPLLRLTNTSGLVPAAYVKSETCDIYADGVIITRQYGSPVRANFVEKKTIVLTGEIAQLIEEASKEKLENMEPMPCDGPSSSIEAPRAGESVVLFSALGCSDAVKTRAGGAANTLRNIVKSVCPEAWAP